MSFIFICSIVDANLNLIFRIRRGFFPLSCTSLPGGEFHCSKICWKWCVSQLSRLAFQTLLDALVRGLTSTTCCCWSWDTHRWCAAVAVSYTIYPSIPISSNVNLLFHRTTSMYYHCSCPWPPAFTPENGIVIVPVFVSLRTLFHNIPCLDVKLAGKTTPCTTWCSCEYNFKAIFFEVYLIILNNLISGCCFRSVLRRPGCNSSCSKPSDMSM